MTFLVMVVMWLAPGGVVESGRMIGIADSPSERLAPPRLIAPGAPPVLSFRLFDAGDRGRFGGLGLMTDDAGH